MGLDYADAKDIFPVYCPNCDWFGMSDDIKYGRCPDCGDKVKREGSSDQ
jgi:endogenous inhibitor of DNA gyrase (YacG/DUF329 family)